MQTDRELLEAAAKAAGIPIGDWFDSAQAFYTPTHRIADAWWNPLTDDGDALRLAVKCGIDFKAYQESVRTWVGDPIAQRVIASIEEPTGTDPYAATRRAIVRAAAAMAEKARA